jgi:hypothetical protein
VKFPLIEPPEDAPPSKPRPKEKNRREAGLVAKGTISWLVSSCHPGLSFTNSKHRPTLVSSAFRKLP